MGVHGLWDLLAPVGRRVSVETLAGKKLAIDASIWMIQFMKAMRDEKGEMIRNAHLVGFFRRICKLLFLRTKPVFVFDGGTPALKRRTVIARRRQRENAQAKIRKTAEKLLLNQLKTMRLKELQEDIRNQRQKNDTELKKASVDKKNDLKGKKIVLDEQIVGEHPSEESNLSSENYNQEALDEMLAASIAAEEGGSFAADASTSGGGIPCEEEDDDEDEEMILPAMHGQVDPAVLAALPPSMQLDLLVQMRERLMAENRQRYQKVKKAPARFSELQIQAYLKTVAFRREIDEVQKSAAGKGIGGVQTSRIASEANREFIFSSSFTGDKQVLTSGGEGEYNNHQSETPRADISTNATHDDASNTTCNRTAESSSDDTGRELPVDVETYLDERGRTRVSRVRAMGIRMTRDLQRNLDLMKEIEWERVVTAKDVNSDMSSGADIINGPNSNPVSHTLDQNNDGMADANHNVKDSAFNCGTSIQISFETNADQKSGDDDDLFAHLVAGEPLMGFSVDDPFSKEQAVESTSDCEWEEGVIDGKVTSESNDTTMKPSLDAGGICDDSGVDWEEGYSNCLEVASPRPTECNGRLSKGALEEEADFQEAIRRSLEDLKDPRTSDTSCENLDCNKCKERVGVGTDAGNFNGEYNEQLESKSPTEDISQPLESPFETQTNISGLDGQEKFKMLPACDTQSAPIPGVNPAEIELPTKNAFESFLNSSEDKNRNVNLHEKVDEKSDTPVGEKEANLRQEDLQLVSNDETAVLTGTKISSAATDSLYEKLQDSTLADAKQKELETTLDGNYHVTLLPRQISSKDTATDIDVACGSSEGQGRDALHLESGKPIADFMRNKDEQVQITESALEEQLLILDEESKQLGNEQKRLERNAESVSSEMFAECQELLQMFGLPYIIAPMEAEAQCAFMELANLVDGVVTDDSDAFLFGARGVYKNIFDDRKYVETYFMKDFENELGLDRDKLIRMALLLGSDYTEGISGIGIVNAIEVVTAFPEEDGLSKFREWIESPDPAILEKFDAQEGCCSSKRGSKVGAINTSEFEDELQKMKQMFMEKHRNVSKNWHIPSSFPSDAIISAYASPHVDKSMEPFAWGKPDLFALRKMCWEKFGWGTKKSDEVLLPVLKEYEKHETQLRLEAFYTFNERFAKIRSKRIKQTIKGITGIKSLDQMDDSLGDVPQSRKKRGGNPSEVDRSNVEKSSSVLERGGSGENIVKISSKKQSRKRKGLTESEGSNRGPSTGANTSLSANNELSAKTRGKRREGSQSTVKRKKKMNSSSRNAETSSDDGLTFEEEENAGVEFEEPHQVRRSGRPRKAVNYSMGDRNFDDSDGVDNDGGDSTDGDAVPKEISADQVIVGDSSSGADKKDKKPGDLGQDYLGDLPEGGADFCKEDAEPNIILGESNVGQNDDSLGEAELSKDYLEIGGGFCLDDEADENSGGSPSSPNQKMMFADPDLSNCPCPGEEKSQESDCSQLFSICRASSPNEQSKARADASETDINVKEATCKDSFTCLQEAVDDDACRDENTRPLRAMPNLRRRRKR